MAENHVSLAVVFDVPEGQEFKSKFGEMYNIVKSGTPECLYYGFATCGNRVLCREGYATAAGALAHGKEVKEIFQGVVGQIGADRVKMLVMGTKEDLDLLRPHLPAARFITLAPGAMVIKPLPKGCPDTHVTLLPEFTVPAGKMDDFTAEFPKFISATKGGAGAAGCFYYGFGVEGSSVFCREGYDSAESVTKHGADVKEMLEEAVKAVGTGGLKINVVGPKAEIEKLKPSLEPRGAIFWELDAGALWR